MSELTDNALVLEQPEIQPDSQLPLSPALTATSLLARNAVLNFIAEGWTFLVLLVAMPRLVSTWGETFFGLFSLAWVVIGYLNFLDVGVNRAATKFISEHLAGRDIESVPGVVRTAFWANLSFGFLGGFLVLALSPYLIHSVFKISGPLQREAHLVFYVVAAAIPVLLAQGIFRAVLSSYQRFGLINSVNALTVTAQWGTAIFLAWKGAGVALVVLSTVIARLAGVLVFGALTVHLVPGLRLWSPRTPSGLFKLLKFGSWVSLSQVISPVLVYLDRILIASFVSLGAVTLYTVPFEAMTRLRIIPTSLVNTLYPAFSERGIGGQERGLQRLYEGSVRYLLILTLPFIIVLAVLGPDLLSLWMGKQFSAQASIVLEILSIGVLLNCMANIPYNALQALGRPDLTGKFHLIELPFYFALCMLLIPRWGIAGAALANSVRISADAILLFWAARRYCGCGPGPLKGALMRTLAANAGLALLLLVTRLVHSYGYWPGIIAVVFGLGLYFVTIWTVVVDPADRRRISATLVRFREAPVA